MTLPNLITFLAIALSWLAIIYLLQFNLFTSFLLALAAFFVDCWDGLIARKLNQTSSLGRSLDSLGDSLLFLVYPALVWYYYFGFASPASLVVQAIFLISGIFRLARFDTIGLIQGKSYPGIPVVFSLVVVLLTLLFRQIFPSTTVWLLVHLVILVHSALMVSRLPFPKPSPLLVLVLITSVFLTFFVYGQNLV